MTTAARPTFDPARGGTGRGEKDLSAISRQYSSRDLPGHTKLKYRFVVVVFVNPDWLINNHLRESFTCYCDLCLIRVVKRVVVQ